MRLGIMSDLHMEFSHWTWFSDRQEEKDTFYVIAGDIHSNFLTRQRYICNPALEAVSLHVLGNHDYYHRAFPKDPLYGTVTKTLPNGMKIAGATLWTDLSNPVDWGNYLWMLVDAKFIDNLTYEAYNEAHKVQKEFLFNSEADIIVSHHAPSYKSMHPRYAGQLANPGFMTELEPEILAMKKPPKLWIHGHVHDPFDYMIGETRVICWPRGYPGERSYFHEYWPKMIEI